MANSADPDQKPTDLDLHCLRMQGISGLSMTRVIIVKDNIDPTLHICGLTTLLNMGATSLVTSYTTLLLL